MLTNVTMEIAPIVTEATAAVVTLVTIPLTTNAKVNEHLYMPQIFI